MSKFAIVLLLTSYSLCSGYKLLLVFPFPSVSHSALGEGYVRNLLKAGHEVTYITPYPIKNATEGLRQIEVMNNTKMYPDATTFLNKEHYMDEIETVYNIALNITNATVMHANVQKLLNDTTEEFDAVIVEWMYSEVYAGFSSVFNCPLIWSSPMEPNALTLMLLNEHPNAYTPGLLAFSNQPSSYWRRLVEQFDFLHAKIHKWLLSDIEKSVFNKAFGPVIVQRGDILPPFEWIKYNGSLLLGNSHFSTGQTFRLPLNYIQIAGYHIDEKSQPLSKNLKKIMDGSKNGVVYFSMGSILRGDTGPDEAAILEIFNKINRTVIWHHDRALKTPKNVHVFKKVPQQSILAHPNCILFITNGELLSVIEAIHFAVPIIGIPISGDQFNNIEKAVNQGFAKKVIIHEITTFKAAIDDVLRNSKYRDKVEELSLLYYDRPMSPGKELVFWVEHVIRTRGALHLRSPVLLPWYHTAYLELIIVISIAVTSFCVLIVLCISRRRKNYDDLSFKKYI